jgi:rod shape-determining protein MreC
MNGVGDRPKKKSRTEIYLFLTLSLFSFSLLLFSTKSFIVDFRSTGLTFFSGLRIGMNSLSSFVGRTALSVQELANLRREYNELLARMTRYEQLEHSSAEIRQENERLRQQLGFSSETLYKHIAAEITGRDPDNLYSAFSINKGEKDGLQKDMCVVAYQNGQEAVVGKIIETSGIESLIMPIYNSGAFVSARFAHSRFEGIVEGQGMSELPLFMRFITKRARETVHTGDLIVTSGLGGVYPAGITIGRVKGIFFDENETSMAVNLEPVIDFSRLEYVFILVRETNVDLPQKNKDEKF